MRGEKMEEKAGGRHKQPLFCAAQKQDSEYSSSFLV